MGQPSSEASNAIIYLTYGLFLLLGLYLGWTLRKQSKANYLASNKTQKALPLALNFIASGLGSGVLFAYPEIATITGIQGLIIYAFSSSLPILIFGALGPAIRRQCPDGFVLTEWTRRRYGATAAILLSLATLLTMFLYMVAELSALQQIVTALTGLDGLPAVIVQCVVTTIYTSIGGFKVSFKTDVIQGVMVVALIIIATISVGVETEIDRDTVDDSGLLDSSLLGWQLIYILPVAIFSNVFFLAGFWLRTFASRTDKDLRIGTSIATFVILIILLFVGTTGLLAVWSDVEVAPEEGYLAFFLLLRQLPAWVVGIVLCMVVSLSTAAFDTFQSAMVSTASNDIFRNRLGLWWIRLGVVVLVVPVIVVALESPDILQIYLISDLISASLIPVLIIGLWKKFYFWRGFEVVVGGLGGLFTVFLFGTVYYGDAERGAELLLLEGGLYANDWSVFGAFVAAPLGGILWALGALALRLSVQYAIARKSGQRFTALDRPVTSESSLDNTDESVEVVEQPWTYKDGKFF